MLTHAGALERMVRCNRYRRLVCAARACCVVLAPRLAAAVQHVRYIQRARATQLLLAAARRALVQQSASQRARCRELQVTLRALLVQRGLRALPVQLYVLSWYKRGKC